MATEQVNESLVEQFMADVDDDVPTSDLITSRDRILRMIRRGERMEADDGFVSVATMQAVADRLAAVIEVR